MNEREKAFVREFLIDLNVTKAAIRAKYSEKTAYSQGSRLLKKVEVRKAIQKAIKAREKRTEITADRILNELAAVGFGKPADLLKFQDKIRALDKLGQHLNLWGDGRRGDLNPEDVQEKLDRIIEQQKQIDLSDPDPRGRE